MSSGRRDQHRARPKFPLLRVGLALLIWGAGPHSLQSMVLAAQLRQPDDTVSTSRKVYYWRARSHDVSSSETDEDRQLLAFLLSNALEEDYRVRPGDGLDIIVTRQYFVNPLQHPNAFELYKREVRRRNEGALASGRPMFFRPKAVRRGLPVRRFPRESSRWCRPIDRV